MHRTIRNESQAFFNPCGCRTDEIVYFGTDLGILVYKTGPNDVFLCQFFRFQPYEPNRAQPSFLFDYRCRSCSRSFHSPRPHLVG